MQRNFGINVGRPRTAPAPSREANLALVAFAGMAACLAASACLLAPDPPATGAWAIAALCLVAAATTAGATRQLLHGAARPRGVARDALVLLAAATAATHPALAALPGPSGVALASAVSLVASLRAMATSTPVGPARARPRA